jgi:hypothetical protein
MRQLVNNRRRQTAGLLTSEKSSENIQEGLRLNVQICALLGFSGDKNDLELGPTYQQREQAVSGVILPPYRLPV